ATVRTLGVNGWAVREVPGQVCCGALHAHSGLRDEARLLARANVAAFGPGDEPIVVNSAGCGAMLKEYEHLVDATSFAARVRDVTELLARGGGPRPGAPVDVQVAYDPPCHLLHAQRIADEPPRARRDPGAPHRAPLRRGAVLRQCRSVHAARAGDVARRARAQAGVAARRCAARRRHGK